MSRSSLHDGMLCREIMVFDPFTRTEKSTVAKCADFKRASFPIFFYKSELLLNLLLLFLR